MQKITTFLMFEGKAEEAMTFYMSLFENSRILSITRYGPQGPGAEGTVVHATSSLGGQFRIGVPFTDIDTVTLGIGYEKTDITTFDDSPLRITSYVNTFGNNNSSLLGTVGWARDTRDSAI